MKYVYLRSSVSLLLIFCGVAALAAESVPQVDSKQTFQFLVEQVSFGPRIPESTSTEKTRQLIFQTLAESGFSTHTQHFRAYVPVLGREVHGQNIYAIKPKGQNPLVVYSAHYDTRPIAEKDPRPEKRTQPIPGANDGASGVAVLLGIAKALSNVDPPKPLALVFFDLEDGGLPQDPSGFCLGSRYLAANLPPELVDFECGINLDMVGKRKLRVLYEKFSFDRCPDLVEQVWSLGEKVAPDVFVKQRGIPIYDDHVPFQEMGKKYINLIDFDYPQWHTSDDSVEQCSSESLKTVGDTLLRYLFQ